MDGNRQWFKLSQGVLLLGSPQAFLYETLEALSNKHLYGSTDWFYFELSSPFSRRDYCQVPDTLQQS